MIKKLNKKDYTVGQEVALLLYGNKRSYKDDGAYIKGKITKIGSKIIYIKNESIHENIKINMETGFECTEYTPNYIMFDSEDMLIDYLDSQILIKEVRNIIGQYGNTNIKKEKLEKILQLLKE